MKTIMGLETTWKEKKVHKIQEYVNKKMVGFEAFVPLAWSKLLGMASYVSQFHWYLNSTKRNATIPIDTQQRRNKIYSINNL
jgi:hypothetical protein